jgi:hypothetical protein
MRNPGWSKSALSLGLALATTVATAGVARADDEPCLKYGLPVSEIGTLSWQSADFNPRIIPDPIWANYAQSGYRLVDPAGDFSLAMWAKNTPKKIEWALKGDQKNLERVDRIVEEAKSCALLLFGVPALEAPVFARTAWAPDRRDVELIDRLGFSPEVTARLQEELRSGKLAFEALEGLWPTRGEPHRWDPRMRESIRKRFWPYADTSKLLIALARGDTNRYMVTGKEAELQSWMLAQDDESITHDQLFRSSYRTNRGDLYLTMMTIENVLARYWRVSGRDGIDFIRKLKPFTNSFGRATDTFGTWYHFYGVMLLGFVEGGSWAQQIGAIENLGSVILAKGKQKPQKLSMNLMGGPIGAALRFSVDRGEWTRRAPDKRRLEPSSWLRPDAQIVTRLYERAAKIRQELAREAAQGGVSAVVPN